MLRLAILIASAALIGAAAPNTALPPGADRAIIDRVKQCWNMAPRTAPKTVTLRVTVDEDGYVKAAEAVDDGGDAPAARRLLRALRNPACQPLPEPMDGWPKTPFSITVDPAKAF